MARVSLSFLSSEKNEDLWIRPYFDPTTKELRFQGRDGEDAGPRKRLYHLAVNTSHRPLLKLVVAEGLLESIPGQSTSPARGGEIHEDS